MEDVVEDTVVVAYKIMPLLLFMYEEWSTHRASEHYGLR